MTSLQISKLTIPQRITLAEELWDSVARDQGILPIDKEDIEFVDSRLREIESNNEKLISWDVLKKQTRGLRK